MLLSKILRNTGLFIVVLGTILFAVPASYLRGFDPFEMIRIALWAGIGMLIISILIKYPLIIYIKKRGEEADARILKVKRSILRVGSYGRKTLLTFKIEVFPSRKSSFVTEVECAIPLWGELPQEGQNIRVKCLPEIKRAVLMESIFSM